METQTAVMINLDVITFSTTNGLFRPPKEITEESLNELASSIQQHGVIQPILVRPAGDNKTYNLICGERRVRAGRLAGLTEIPASIREIDDHHALILQITENMQREGVHPLNEAKGYKVLLESDPHSSTSDLSLRFGKSETYILQRLKLNELCGPAIKDYYQGLMTLGHALILSRLTDADQRQVLESIRSERNSYGSVPSLQEFVDQHIIHVLSKAPFDVNDTDLHKKAGSCMGCPKRSGASPMLFAEIKEKDKCFDSQCFHTKCHKFLNLRIREVIETQPEVFLLCNYHEPSEPITNLIRQHNITPLKEYEGFSTHKTAGKKVKGLWISGDLAGHTVNVYLTERTSKKTDAISTPSEIIEKIQFRVNRGKELDREKVYGKILESLKEHPSQKKDYNAKMLPDEEIFVWYIILDKAGYEIKNELMRHLGLSRLDPEKVYLRLKKLKAEEKAFMLRRVMLNQYGGNYPDSAYAFIIHKIAKSYGDIEINQFEKEQQEVRNKREQRAKDRIRLLRQQNTK